MMTQVLPRSVQLLDGPGGLPFLRVNAPGGAGEIFLHGAHLTSWTPTGQRPALWMSDVSRFAENTPIRGGVPICFPWFGLRTDHPVAPQHGFARLAEWTLTGASESGDAVRLEFRLTDTEQTRESPWPYRFEAIYTVTIGSKLQLEFEVVNRDTRGFSFEAALHNYYAIDDLLSTRVLGLEGHEFFSDSVPGKAQTPVQLGGAINRRYPTVTGGRIEESTIRRMVTVSSAGSEGVVLWNPGPDTARAMEDFSDSGWPNMVCFETCNIGESQIELAPGKRHLMCVTVTVVTY